MRHMQAKAGTNFAAEEPTTQSASPSGLVGGYAFLFFSVVGLAHKGIFYKLLLHHELDAAQIIALRWFVGAPLLLLLLFRLPRVQWRLPRKREIAALLQCTTLGGVSMLLHTESFDYLPAGIAAVLVFVYPALLVVAPAVFHRRMPATGEILRVAVLFLCLGLLIDGVPSVTVGTLSGYAYALAAAVAFAWQVHLSGDIMGGRYGDTAVPSLLLSLWVHLLLAGAGAGILTLHMPDPDCLANPQVWYLVGGMAIVSAVLPFTAWLVGLARVGKINASLAAATTPAVSAILASFWLGEVLYAGPVAAVFLMFLAMPPRQAWQQVLLWLRHPLGSASDPHAL